ncbi:MAG: hypothetical protein ACTSP0_10630 [Alphaproteobacteria bacterium]
MRTFLRPRARPLGTVIFAATALLMWSPFALAKQAKPLISGVSATETPPVPQRKPLHRLAELRSRLDQKDHIVAMRALHLALTQVEDGGTFMWQKRSRSLKGMIKPSKAFRNTDGRVCRHVIYALSLGRYLKQIEGIACRQNDGSWQL